MSIKIYIIEEYVNFTDHKTGVDTKDRRELYTRIMAYPTLFDSKNDIKFIPILY